MSNPVQEYCRQQGYASFVIEEGLDYLVPRWEGVVKHIAQDYSRMMFLEYLNDRDARQILHEVFPIATEFERSSVKDRIEAADSIYLAHTVFIGECIWGEELDKENGYSPQVNWWYYREPKRRDENW